MDILNEFYPLSLEQIERFRGDGFIRLPGVLDEATITTFLPEIRRITYENNPNRDKSLDERDTYGKAFIQVTNLWTRGETVKQFAFNRRIARIATELLGTEGVRMWHDQTLFKEPSGGFTPWHVDQQYWPMSSGLTVTAWIPLQAVPLEMGPLCFGRGSHRKNIARDLEISDISEQLIESEIKQQQIDEVQEPYSLGDVSFHFGWTLHRAGPNVTDHPREVFTIIYMDEQMRLAKPNNANQQLDWDVFSPSSKPGEIMSDPLNPVLYSSASGN